jgi:hypothetical protein
MPVPRIYLRGGAFGAIQAILWILWRKMVEMRDWGMEKRVSGLGKRKPGKNKNF